MSNTSSQNNSSTCANCGKVEEAGSNLKSCAACKLVKYCSRECQIAHRPQHKKACKKRAKELHDEKLFKQPPPLEDCPICLIRLPSLETGRVYMTCCGKIICCGCMHAFKSSVENDDEICPFCRAVPPYLVVEAVARIKKRVELNDTQAIYQLGLYYAEGTYGLPQNIAKALELWHRAGELGSAGAYANIAHAYKNGFNVERNMKKAKHYWELSAMGGDGNAGARRNLGVHEGQARNFDRALRHFMIAVSDGDSDSLEIIKRYSLNGYATKDDHANALRDYQAYVDEIKSEQRDEAAAFREDYKYYESAI